MKKRDWIYCIITLLIWSSSSAIVSIFTKNCNPFVVFFFVITISFLFQTTKLLRPRFRTEITKFSTKEIKKLFIPALLGLTIYPITYFLGINGSSPLKANILNYLWPVIAFVTSFIIQRKKPTLIDSLSIIFAVLGGVIVLTLSAPLKQEAFYAKDIVYGIYALIGAFSYGIYTGIIHNFIPSYVIDKQTLPMSASHRLFFMTLISFLVCIPLIIILEINNSNSIGDTILTLIENRTQLFAIIFYSLINFTLAHTLWNKINASNHITITANTAYIIPLLSTIILSITTKQHLNTSPLFGFFLIIFSLIISNYKYLNSINITFISIIIFLFIDRITPFTNNTELINSSKFYLEILIAMYSIFYGFLLNRINSEYLKFLRKVDDISHAITIITLSSKNSDTCLLINLKTWLRSIDHQNNEYRKLPDNIATQIFELPNTEDRSYIFNSILAYTRCGKHLLSIIEFFIIILLTIFIIVLCFIIRSNNLLSICVSILICCTVILCLSLIYEYERKCIFIKKRFFENLDKMG